MSRGKLVAVNCLCAHLPHSQKMAYPCHLIYTTSQAQFHSDFVNTIQRFINSWPVTDYFSGDFTVGVSSRSRQETHLLQLQTYQENVCMNYFESDFAVGIQYNARNM